MQFLVGLLFLLLPFERLPTWEWQGFTVKLSYLCALVLLGVFITKKPRQLFAGVPLTFSDFALIGLWFSAAASLISALNEKRGVIILLLWGLMFILYTVVARLLVNKALRHRVERYIIGISVLVALFGLYQFLGDSFGLPLELTGLRQQYTKIVFGFPRIQSVALEPLYFSNYLLLPLFLVWQRLVSDTKNRAAYFVISLLFLVNIILGISRGAYLGLVCGVGLVLLFLLSQKRKEVVEAYARLGGSIACALLFSFVLVWGINGSTAIANFGGHAAVNDREISTSVPGRLEAYRSAISLFKTSPLLGIGVGNFGPRTVQSEAGLKEFGYGIVNNEYLEILTETGLIGLFFFVLFMASWLSDYFKAFKKQSGQGKLKLVFLLGAVLAIAVQYNFFSTLYILPIWLFLAYIRSFSLEN